MGHDSHPVENRIVGGFIMQEREAWGGGLPGFPVLLIKTGASLPKAVG
jgi:hypothetical protein